MSKCTVIIPTLENCLHVTDYLVEQIQHHTSSVDEIIFINNRVNDTFTERYKGFSKVKVIHNMPNLYVNPAWNYGMTLTKTKYYALINDDVLFHGQVIDQIIDLLEMNGALNLVTVTTRIEWDVQKMVEALHREPFNPNTTYDMRSYPDSIKQGWFMLARTETWKSIPASPTTLIMCGDDHILGESQIGYSGIALLTSNNLYHAESSTVKLSQEQFDSICKPQDLKAIEQYTIGDWNGKV
jgi:glycosyltransferase involved in cell wall biosynthesis